MYDCFHHWQIFDNITSGSKFGDFFNFWNKIWNCQHFCTKSSGHPGYYLK
jgi:hypothetical protein